MTHVRFQAQDQGASSSNEPSTQVSLLERRFPPSPWVAKGFGRLSEYTHGQTQPRGRQFCPPEAAFLLAMFQGPVSRIQRTHLQQLRQLGFSG